MLLREFKYQLFAPECNPTAETLNCLAAFSDDVSAVFPYLNAVLKGCVYRPEAGILSFRHEGKFFTLFPRRAAITRVADDADAQRTLLWLQDLINRTYSARETITPSYKSCDVLKALDVYRLLPGLNCGECGEATCLAFALKVVAQTAEIASCRPLFSGRFEDRRERLVEALIGAGYEVPATLL
ncbi:MAG: (Fe-S)-binding protein [Armatimonadota bacterium]|nr:(Fe-S)-binding protein [Armatimonadota bacterium]MDR7464801.1 (Fe-S)-binding protein [Armatimonadota bacterium]MDR7470122.1 (Fe-S)-binding protein [Armatimonadota bacterium]MDR7475729.1 (Fe-S)-binding protein [Armatimonadota bacterium]MDR7537915.1 (Fe-S)-binding protein [Armatimonadota bacterium]